MTEIEQRRVAVVDDDQAVGGSLKFLDRSRMMTDEREPCHRQTSRPVAQRVNAAGRFGSRSSDGANIVAPLIATRFARGERPDGLDDGVRGDGEKTRRRSSLHGFRTVAKGFRRLDGRNDGPGGHVSDVCSNPAGASRLHTFGNSGRSSGHPPKKAAPLPRNPPLRRKLRRRRPSR